MKKTFTEKLIDLQARWNRTLSEVARARMSHIRLDMLTPEAIVHKLERATIKNLEAKKGTIQYLILAGPTAGGKGTIGEELQKAGVIRLARTTSRLRRITEIKGVHYDFVTRGEFDLMVRSNEFLQYSYMYNKKEGRGTPKKIFFNLINMKKKFFIEGSARTPPDFTKQPETSHFILASIAIMPPSFKILIERLLKRTEEDQAITNEDMLERLENSIKLLAQSKDTIDTFLVNDNFHRVGKMILENL